MVDASRVQSAGPRPGAFDGVDAVAYSISDGAPRAVIDLGGLDDRRRRHAGRRRDGFHAALDLGVREAGRTLGRVNDTPLEETNTSVSGAGDANGDGIADLIVGAPSAGAGEALLVFGAPQGLPRLVERADIDGRNGVVLAGIDSFDEVGCSVSAAGDVNGDGFDDVVIGARFARPGDLLGAGESYILFGRPSPIVDTASATLSVSIAGPNDPPVAADDGGAGFATDENTAFFTPTALANDVDPDPGDSLRVVAIRDADMTAAGRIPHALTVSADSRFGPASCSVFVSPAVAV